MRTCLPAPPHVFIPHQGVQILRDLSLPQTPTLSPNGLIGRDVRHRRVDHLASGHIVWQGGMEGILQREIDCLSTRRLECPGCRARRSWDRLTGVREKGSVVQATSHSPILQKDHPKPGHWSERTSKDWIGLRSLGVVRKASHYLAILASSSGFLRRAHLEPLSQYLSSCACLLGCLWPPSLTHASTL